MSIEVGLTITLIVVGFGMLGGVAIAWDYYFGDERYAVKDHISGLMTFLFLLLWFLIFSWGIMACVGQATTGGT